MYAHGGNVKKYDDRVVNEYYPTPPVATYSLVKSIVIPNKHVWEPAAGRGHISKELERLGFTVTSTDLHTYDDPLVSHISTGLPYDFLKMTEDEGGLIGANIITNPPFKGGAAQKFVEKGLELGSPFIAVLCRIAWLQSLGRHKFFTMFPPSDVFVLSARLNCSEKYVDNEPLGGMAPYAWYVWQNPARRPHTHLHWVDMEQMYIDWNKSL